VGAGEQEEQCNTQVCPDPRKDSWRIAITTGKCLWPEIMRGCDFPGTDGKVQINLIGAKEMTGWLDLDNAVAADPSKDIFEEGNTDTFQFDTEPVGDFKEAWIRLDGDDRWRCKEVTVQQTEAGQGGGSTWNTEATQQQGMTTENKFHCSWIRDDELHLSWPISITRRGFP